MENETIQEQEILANIPEIDSIEADLNLPVEGIATEMEIDSLGLDEEITEEPAAKIELESGEGFGFQLDCFDEAEQEDLLWKARTGLDENTLCGAIETIVFMSDRPIKLQKIKSFIDLELPLRVLHDAISRLQDEYEKSHHGLRLQEVAEGYQFRTKATYSKYIQDIFKINSMVLSPTALEVLAIIAYKQPISKSEIEKIRGVDSSHIVRALMDKRLVQIVGRSEDLGRPSLCGTTLEFLEVFNLKSLDELPPEHELETIANTSEVGAIADIKEIVGGNKDLFDFDDTKELDSLRETINGIAANTAFTKSLNVESKKKVLAENGVIAKSAFEVLEEYVHRDEVEGENNNAVASEVLTNIFDPRVVDLKEVDQLLNAPIEDDDEDLIPTAEFADSEEGEFISAALDDAFSKLMSDTGPKKFEEEADVSEFIVDIDNIDDKLDAIDETTQKALDCAKDLDLDLDFMQQDDSIDSAENDFFSEE